MGLSSSLCHTSSLAINAEKKEDELVLLFFSFLTYEIAIFLLLRNIKKQGTSVPLKNSYI